MSAGTLAPRAGRRGRTRALLAVTAAECVKIARRPALLVLFGSSAALLVHFAQVRRYLSYLDSLAPGSDAPEWALETAVTALQPSGAVMLMLSEAAGFAGVTAAVFGALLVGSEHAWATVRTLGLQGPTRLLLSTGKVVAAALTVLVFCAALLALLLAGAFLVAARAGLEATPPPLAEVAAGLGIGWAVLLVPALAGMTLAAAFRSTAAGIGGTLLWLFLVESAAFETGTGGAGWAHALSPLANATAATAMFGRPGLAEGAAVHQPISPGRGLLWTVAYALVLAALAAWLPTRREIRA